MAKPRNPRNAVTSLGSGKLSTVSIFSFDIDNPSLSMTRPTYSIRLRPNRHFFALSLRFLSLTSQRLISSLSHEKLCLAPAIYNAIVEIHFATAVYETVKDCCHHLLLKVRGGTTRAKRQSCELKHPHETYKCRIDSVGCVQRCLVVTRG